MPKLGAHKVSEFKAVSTAPSINKTQVGNSVVPLPYPTTQDLGSSVGVVPTVRFRGTPAYVLDQSSQPSCTGDSPGSLKGVKSGTVNGEVKPTSASGSVRAGGKYVVRIGDSNTMNGGNNPGVYVAVPPPSGGSAKAAAGGADQSPVRNATPAEQSFMDKVKRTVKELAQGYKDDVSPTLHEAADNAMNVGGKVAGAGGLTMAAGTGVAATGVGLPVAAGMEAVGGTGVAVGGTVSAVGGVTDAGASTLDSAADWILTGKTPDIVGFAVGIVENAVINRITSMIPGGKAVVSEVKALKTEVKTEAHAAKNEVKQEEKQAEQAVRDRVASEIGNNVNVPGSGNGEDGRCKLRKYSELKCPSGQDAHHVLPDRAFRPGKRGTGAFPGGVSEDDGLAVCLESNKLGKEAEHTRAHEFYDKAEKELSKNPDSPIGLTLLGKAEDLAAESVEKATKGACSKDRLKQQLRDYHNGKFKLSEDSLVRASKTKVPEEAVEHLGRPASKARIGGGRVR
jgi:hypothetical protein